jgi:hypothetical protein
LIAETYRKQPSAWGRDEMKYYHFVSYCFIKHTVAGDVPVFRNTEVMGDEPIETLLQIRNLEKAISETDGWPCTILSYALLRKGER